jgi:hypothetical protein
VVVRRKITKVSKEDLLMKVDWANDIGAPAAVTVVNVMARASETQIGNTPIADVATYAMAAG